MVSRSSLCDAAGDWWWWCTSAPLVTDFTRVDDSLMSSKTFKMKLTNETRVAWSIFIEYSKITSKVGITVYISQLWSESSLGWYSATCFNLSPPFPGSKSELLDPPSNPLSKLLNGSSISSPLVTADSWTTSTARREISFVIAQTNDKIYSNHLYTYRNARSTV